MDFKNLLKLRIFFLHSKCADCPIACTPVSVLPEPIIFTFSLRILEIIICIVFCFVFPFEIVSFVLLAALIGGITLARKDEALVDENQV